MTTCQQHEFKHILDRRSPEVRVEELLFALKKPVFTNWPDEQARLIAGRALPITGHWHTCFCSGSSALMVTFVGRQGIRQNIP